MVKYLFAFFVLSSPLLLISCTSNETSNDPKAIYFDYKIWGDEDAGYMTVRLQYRFAGRNGTTLLLEKPAKAELDSIEIKADSSKMNGAYYEISQPTGEFAGKHTIVFTDINKKQYREEFTFHPISLRTPIPAMVNRGDLVFDLDGLEPLDFVRVLLNDTAAFSEGIDYIDTVKNGHITITQAQLRRLENGPVHLEFSKEDEKRIKNGTPGGGRLSISYGLRRDFELQDMPLR
jgi:hypothetical protein